jgi:hypothetical protein
VAVLEQEDGIIMARDAQGQAKQSFKQAQGLTNQYAGNAQGTYGALSPELHQEAINPMGLTPLEKSDMITGSEQALGGSQAGAVGAGNLEAARTRNVGGADAAIAEAARAAGRQQSANALTVAGADANLKEQQRQAGLKGEQDVLGLETGSTLGALGQQTGATNALSEAQKNGWFQQMLEGINAVAGAGKAAFPKGLQG